MGSVTVCAVVVSNIMYVYMSVCVKAAQEPNDSVGKENVLKID